MIQPNITIFLGVDYSILGNQRMLRPIYTMRFVAYDSYSGICHRVNTRKKRQISSFAISERVKIWQ